MSSEVGARMLVLRKLNGWSQRHLAKRAGVPHSAISMIEHGQVSPSINSLQKVLDGVPISLADFFALDMNLQVRVFHKSKNIAQQDEAGVTRSKMSTRGGFGGLDLVRESYPPDTDIFVESSDSGKEMIGYVVSGSLEVTVGGEIEMLNAGDGFYFECRRPHRFRNQSKKPAEIVAALLPGSRSKSPG